MDESSRIVSANFGDAGKSGAASKDDGAFDLVLAHFAHEIGASRVSVEEGALERVNRATFSTEARARAIVLAVTRSEVAACLRIASRYRVSVYPVSLGRNWGYGSAVAPRDNYVLLSLAGLADIEEFDERLGTVSLGPGVTFRALRTFLSERRSRFSAPMTGSSPDTSVVGNIMERGMAKWFYQSMADHVDAFEAVLANGDPIAGRTEGPGPRLWGLIPQNNIAVVTRLTLRLESFPVWRQQVTCPLHDARTLEAALDRLRPELQRGARMHLEFINDYRLAAQLEQFPYATFDGSEPLGREWIAERLRLPLGEQWFCGATIWGDEDAGLSIERRRLARAFADIGAAPDQGPPIAGSAPAPENEGLRCAYWRKRRPMPPDPDPDRDRCGVIWIAPELTMSGARAREIVGDMEATMLEHRFEPALSIRVVDARALRIVAGLFYDRDTPGDDARAAECRRALQSRLAEAGVHGYRRGLLDAPPRGDAVEERLRAAIKAAADPAGILAPGRYGSADA